MIMAKSTIWLSVILEASDRKATLNFCLISVTKLGFCLPMLSPMSRLSAKAFAYVRISKGFDRLSALSPLKEECMSIQQLSHIFTSNIFNLSATQLTGRGVSVAVGATKPTFTCPSLKIRWRCELLGPRQLFWSLSHPPL